MKKELKELFLVDTGTLIYTNDEDFEEYYSVYDHEYGYYDDDQYYTRNLEEAKLFAMECVESKIPNFYLIIVAQGLSKLSDKKIANGNYDIIGANYNVKDIVWSIKTDSNGLNPVVNFVKGQKNYNKVQN